jgi:hypothetical protein
MKKLIAITGLLALATALVFSAQDPPQPQKKGGKKGSGTKKMELPHPFYWAGPDPYRGDWQGTPGFVAQVFPTHDKAL